MFVLDHLFVLGPLNAPVADRLAALGFEEGLPNTHPGQGTANRRFFFENLMLEFLWIHDPRECQSGAAQRMRLVERLTRGSPFGFCLRPASPNTSAKPFAGEDVYLPYLPKGRSVFVGDNVENTHEPLCFFLDFLDGPAPSPQPQDRRRVTSLTLHGRSSDAPISPTLQQTLDHSSVRQVPTLPRAPLLGLSFERGRSGQNHSFEPDCPLQLSWWMAAGVVYSLHAPPRDPLPAQQI